eukprot:scaffold12455_cov62-Phaeocystis_antarctica.AAC.4
MLLGAGAHEPDERVLQLECVVAPVASAALQPPPYSLEVVAVAAYCCCSDPETQGGGGGGDRARGGGDRARGTSMHLVADEWPTSCTARLRGQPHALCEEARSLPAHVQLAAARRAVRALPHQMHRALLIDDVDALHKSAGRRGIGVLPHAHALCKDQGAKVECERMGLGVLGARRPRTRRKRRAGGVRGRAGGLNCRPVIVAKGTACLGRSGVLGELARVRA